MKLEILSLSESIKYEPKDKTGIIRIFNASDEKVYRGLHVPPKLIESPNWVGIKEYHFDDQWPGQDERMSIEYALEDVWTRTWKEYKDISEISSRNLLEEFDKIKKILPKMTKESFLILLETRGQENPRPTYFTKTHARDIWTTYETEWKGKIDTLVIHCTYGNNRAPAIGIAMNERLGWGIQGLKETHPNYRRFIYEVMIGV